MSRERYISMSNGDLVMVTENDSYSLAARGPEREERRVTLEELKGTKYYDAAKSLLAKAKPLKSKSESKGRKSH